MWIQQWAQANPISYAKQARLDMSSGGTAGSLNSMPRKAVAAAENYVDVCPLP